ncbi:hypothetical protein Scep_030403 [Stephania cephalantha]|uniref:Uncharacterized protein n=1 Tax=Stephania cephalantha TaxID=152367 RepID=A0AAP0E325_9MAGN
MDDLCLIDDPHLLGMARTKTIEVPKKSEQEKENTAKSEQVGKRAQTSSYKKEKELQLNRIGEKGGKKKLKKTQNKEMKKSDENRETDREDGEEGGEGDEEGSGSEGISESGSGSGSGSASASGSQDGSTEEEEEGSASRGNDEEGEGEREKIEEEVVEVRPCAKARGKAKSGLSDKVTIDDSFKPFLGGPINHELLTSFNNHVPPPYGITRWDVKVEQGLNAEHVQRIRRALDHSNMHVRQAVDVIMAWKVLPPRESDKASAVKMANDALKLLTMFGSPTPSQLKSKPAEGVSSSKRRFLSGDEDKDEDEDEDGDGDESHPIPSSLASLG